MRILAAVSFPRKDDQKITNETREKAIATVGNKMSHEDSTEKS